MFSSDKRSQFVVYKRFISLAESPELVKHYSKKNTPSILGDKDFITLIKERFSKKQKEKEIPESTKLCPETIDIKNAVCAFYKLEESDLLKSRRGTENEARDVAMYMLRTIRVEKLTKIGQEFNLSNYSSVSTAVERIKRKMNKRVFRKRYKKILSLL